MCSLATSTYIALFYMDTEKPFTVGPVQFRKRLPFLLRPFEGLTFFNHMDSLP